MHKLSMIVCLAVALLLQVSPAHCQPQNEQNYVNVPLPTWFEFTLGNHPKAFSFSFNNDTDYVLATCDETNQVRVAIPRGEAGGLVFKPELELTGRPQLLVADLDRDARPEVLVSSDKLRIYRVRENGLSLLWTSNETFEGTVPPHLELADFDADGRIDIAVLDYLPDKFTEKKSLSIYLHHKENLQFSLSGTKTFTDQHGYHGTHGLAIGDFSGDERPDIVVGNDNGWMWLVELEQGNPTVKHSWEVPSGGAIGPGLCAGNMVAGAKQELLVGTNGGDIFVYKFPADGPPEVIAQAMTGRLAYSVHAADMDGDGLDEFILARGHLGYARMTEKDVVTQIWKFTAGKLVEMWRKEATGFIIPRLMLQDLDRDGTPEFVTYSMLGKGKPIETIKPVLKR